MGAFGAGLGAAAGNLEKNWDADRQSKRDIMKQEVIHKFRMTERAFTQGAMDTRATSRQAHERGMLAGRTDADMKGREFTAGRSDSRQARADNKADAREERRIANQPKEMATDNEGNVVERPPGSSGWSPSMVGPSQEEYVAGQGPIAEGDANLPGMLSGYGGQKQLNTGKPKSDHSYMKKIKIPAGETAYGEPIYDEEYIDIRKPKPSGAPDRMDKSQWTADWSSSEFSGATWTMKDGKKFGMADILETAKQENKTPEQIMEMIGIDPTSLIKGKK